MLCCYVVSANFLCITLIVCGLNETFGFIIFFSITWDCYCCFSQVNNAFLVLYWSLQQSLMTIQRVKLGSLKVPINRINIKAQCEWRSIVEVWPGCTIMISVIYMKCILWTIINITQFLCAAILNHSNIITSLIVVTNQLNHSIVLQQQQWH